MCMIVVRLSVVCWSCMYVVFVMFSVLCFVFFFFFKQKTAYEMRISDWSSDVCSSDLLAGQPHDRAEDRPDPARRARRRDDPPAALDPQAIEAESEGDRKSVV